VVKKDYRRHSLELLKKLEVKAGVRKKNWKALYRDLKVLEKYRTLAVIYRLISDVFIWKERMKLREIREGGKR
jgi:hypothetical protein